MIPLPILKTSYKAFLTTHYTNPFSIDTALSDTFYLWRKQGAETFWKAVDSNDETVRALLLEALEQSSDSNPERQASSIL